MLNNGEVTIYTIFDNNEEPVKRFRHLWLCWMHLYKVLDVPVAYYILKNDMENLERSRILLTGRQGEWYTVIKTEDQYYHV